MSVMEKCVLGVCVTKETYGLKHCDENMSFTVDTGACVTPHKKMSNIWVKAVGVVHCATIFDNCLHQYGLRVQHIQTLLSSCYTTPL